jgi:peptide/nickel transport system substrate-binding protein
LLALLAQPEMGILRGGQGSGPFRVQRARATTDGLTLTRDLAAAEDEAGQREELLLTAQPPPEAVTAFAAGRTDLVLGGSFVDLPLARQVKLPRNALRFDPASGLFGLVPVHSGGKFDTSAVRQLLSEALDRTNYVNATGVPGLGARATLIEPALEGVAAPTPPAWASVPFRDRLAGLRAQAQELFGQVLPKVSVAVPEGPGGDLLIREFQRDWGAIGITVSKATSARGADFLLIDEVAPSASAAWFVRRFRCGVVPVCSPAADQLMDAARQSPIAAQRYALLAQAAATIDEAQLFIPITAPVRWSLVSPRVQNFAGNRYARHTLTDLGQRSGGE